MAGKRIPYGISNYQTIAREGYLYVDKTRFIRVLEENQEPFVFFLRPRRFGKSLFVSLLSNYYDRLQKDQFNEFFTGTDIWKEPTPKQGSYYVLNFDFSGISTTTEEELVESFSRKIQNYLNLFLAKYNIPITLHSHSSPADVLAEFFSLVFTRIDGQIYVIIDEYDHFANELLGFDIQLFHQSLGGNGFIRKWFEVLKEATKTIVGRIFATGVSPITLDSLTSGFSTARDLTRSPRLHEMMGFTESEVDMLIHEAFPEEIIFPGMSDKLVSLVEEVLHAFSNRDYIGFDEKYLKILIFAYAHMSTLYLVKSEYEISGGYIDIAFLPREPWHPDYYALFELKYIKSGQSSPEAINKALKDGIEQMTRYGSSPEWAYQKKVKRWVLVFAGDRCVHNREVTP